MTTPLLPAFVGVPEVNKIYNMDAMSLLRAMPDNSVNCVVTSPPYFGLRDYGMAGQIGLEETPLAYVAKLVELFREFRRVLRDDGTFWLNLGDSYVSSPPGNSNTNSSGLNGAQSSKTYSDRLLDKDNRNKRYTGLPDKNLLGIPWRVAFGLQDDGWILRSDIIWHKPNPMPESVTDRPTKAHEYVFLFAKSQRYYYNADAIREPVVSVGGGNFSKKYTEQQINHGGESNRADYENRNKRDVWTITTKPFSGAHFATFPPDLIEPMILAGCPVDGLVLDPFIGSGTTALVARENGRNYIGSELNPAYVQIARERLAVPFTPMFAEMLA